MAIRTDKGWECSYCGKLFTSKWRADECRDNHDLVYVPMSRSDIARLVQFIMTKEDRILTTTLYNTLQGIVRRERIKLGGIKLNPTDNPQESTEIYKNDLE